LSRKFNQPSIDLLKTFETKDKIADIEIKCYKEKLKAAGVTQYMYVMNQLAIQKFKKEIEELNLEEKAKEDLTLLLLQMFGGEE